MIVDEISFKEYRNLKNAAVKPCAGINVICGDNAQGKTNFLEALWIFSGGRSFRGSKDRDLVAFGKPCAEVKMAVEAFGRKQSLKIDLTNGKRSVTINKVAQKSASALVGRLCAVVFSPTQLALVKDGPSVRRKFLDTAICQIQPHYTAFFFRYNHILNQRNSLLRYLKKDKNLIDTLDVWEENLAECGAEIVSRRFSYLEKLKDLSSDFYSGLSAGKEFLNLHYKTTTVSEFFEDKSQIREEFKLKLKKSREEDIFAGFTTKGPHRDDLDIKINGKSARLFSSQGQQRSIVLAMKLAEAELVKKIIGEPPIILFDDVLSELDLGRQDYLLNSILEKQVFITCCEPELSKRLCAGQIFDVSQGNFVAKK